MNRTVFKAGVIGCGKIAGLLDRPDSGDDINTHAKAYQRHPNFRLIAAVDSSASNLRAFQQTWSVPYICPTVEELQDVEALDVVSICSPDDLHFPQAVKLITSPSKPKVIFIEKPVCLASEELEELSELSQERDVSIVVNHTRRFDAAHQHMARMFRANSLGRLVEGRCTYYGGWLHNGTHAVDTLRMLFGMEPEVIAGDAAGYFRRGDEDLNVRLLVGNAVVHLETFQEKYYQLFQSEFRFENGRARFQDFGVDITVERAEMNEKGERVLALDEGFPMRGLDSPMYHAIEAIDDHLHGKRDLSDTGSGLDDVGKTMRVMWKARKIALSKFDNHDAPVTAEPIRHLQAKGTRTC